MSFFKDALNWTGMNGPTGPTTPTDAKVAENAADGAARNATLTPTGQPAPTTGGGSGPKRTFTVSKADHGVAVGGKYVSPMPLSAAKKAASKLFAKASAGVRKIQFTLRETTRGAGKGEFQYVANKTKLAKPKVIKRGDTEITVHFTYAVRSLDC